MYRRTGGGMSEHDFGETYSFLELFYRTYTINEKAVKDVLGTILDVYKMEFDCGNSNPEIVLKTLRNPRNAGRKQTLSADTIDTVFSLRSTGISIREIAYKTGISKSTVQRLIANHTSQS